MRIDRSIGAALRPTGQTTEVLGRFVEDVLAARSFARAAEVRAQVVRLAPVLSMLLSRRMLGTPALRVQAADMDVRVAVTYEVGTTDDLSLPHMTLLDDLDPDSAVEVTVYATEDVAPNLRALVASVSGHPAHCSFVVTQTAIDGSALPAAVAAADLADVAELEEVDTSADEAEERPIPTPVD